MLVVFYQCSFPADPCTGSGGLVHTTTCVVCNMYNVLNLMNIHIKLRVLIFYIRIYLPGYREKKQSVFIYLKSKKNW